MTQADMYDSDPNFYDDDMDCDETNNAHGTNAESDQELDAVESDDDKESKDSNESDDHPAFGDRDESSDNSESEDITKEEEESSDSDMDEESSNDNSFSEEKFLAESYRSVQSSELDAALGTKHEQAELHLNPPLPTHATHRPTRSTPSMFRRPPPKTMTQPEAIRHAAAATDAKKTVLAERQQKIQEFQAASTPKPMDSSFDTTPVSTPSKLPPTLPSSELHQNPTRLPAALTAIVQSPKPASTPTPPPIPPPPPTNDRTRRRSPGLTPDNETKLQRTGTAPLAPTSLAETARALNFEDTAPTCSIQEAPDPPEKARSRLE